MRYGIIYKATNKVDGKFYIGKTLQKLSDRKIAHEVCVRRGSNTYFHNAIRKYGIENFKFEELALYFEDKLNDAEVEWIEKTKSNTKNVGYNMTEGGDGGAINANHPRKKEIYAQAVETRRKNNKPVKYCREVWIERYGEEEGLRMFDDYQKRKGVAITAAKTGKKYSLEHRQAISESLKGRKIPESVVKKIVETRKNSVERQEKKTKILYLYTEQNYSIKKISRETGISRQLIKNILVENNIPIINRRN